MLTMKSILSLVFVLLLCVCNLSVAKAQFGVKRNAQEAEVGVDGETQVPDDAPSRALVQTLLQHKVLSEQQAVDVATLIEGAHQDPETALLLRRMKEGSGEATFDDFAAEMSPLHIVQGLAQALEELQMLDYLFADPERAFREMEKDGMIPKNKVSEYKKNPALLEEDTRKHLYFSFVSLAAAGGYL